MRQQILSSLFDSNWLVLVVLLSLVNTDKQGLSFAEAFAQTNTNAFVPSSRYSSSFRTVFSSLPNSKSSNTKSDVQLATVESLVGDHEMEGSRLAASIAAWLDREWMPQDIHIRIGMVAKETYVECRNRNEVDISEIMLATSTKLSEQWKADFDKDAFVNAWDIGNYVADYFIQRTSEDACACSISIVNPEEL